MDDRNVTRSHKVILNDRGNGSITGVRDVLSFDVKEVLLETDLGMLMIKGENLHVTKLTLEKGEVEIDGRVDSFIYSDVHGGSKDAGSILGRLFK